jgi:hypothetical protein
MAPDEDRIAAVCCEIQRYLSSHPDAADSVEGIRRWWIARLRLEESARHVQEALNRLVAQGVVIERVMPDGRAVYEMAGRPVGMPSSGDSAS